MRRLSLNARLSTEAQSSEDIEVALMIIRHPDLDAPIKLSTDNTERLSYNPLMYGTRSTWQAEESAEPFLFVIASALLPGDQEDAPAQATIVLENVDNDIAKLLRSFTNRATLDMAVVLASSPDFVELAHYGLKLMTSDGDAAKCPFRFPRIQYSRSRTPRIE